MVVVLNIKGTSVSSFQIGKQGPIVKNNAGTLEFRNSTDTDFVDISANNLSASGELIDDLTPQLGGQLDVNGFAIGNGTEELLKFIEISSAINELTITNAATGNNPRLTASGSDTNVGIDIRAKGTSSINFDTASGSNRQVQINNTASAVNYITLTGSATGNAIAIAAAGADTNIDIQFAPKGTGDVILGSTIAAANSLQGEDDEDFYIKSGASVAADAGDLILEGGDGTGGFAPGNVTIRGGTNGTGTSYIDLDSGVVVGGATGGDQGAGTVNASGYYIDGVVGLTTSLKSLSTKTAAYTTVLADDVVLADSTSSGFTITLGTAAVISGKQQTVKDSGGNSATNNITVETEASETIDGASSIVLENDYESFTFISDGTNWFIKGHVSPSDYGSI